MKDTRTFLFLLLLLAVAASSFSFRSASTVAAQGPVPCKTSEDIQIHRTFVSDACVQPGGVVRWFLDPRIPSVTILFTDATKKSPLKGGLGNSAPLPINQSMSLPDPYNIDAAAADAYPYDVAIPGIKDPLKASIFVGAVHRSSAVTSGGSKGSKADCTDGKVYDFVLLTLTIAEHAPPGKGLSVSMDKPCVLAGSPVRWLTTPSVAAWSIHFRDAEAIGVTSTPLTYLNPSPYFAIGCKTCISKPFHKRFRYTVDAIGSEDGKSHHLDPEIIVDDGSGGILIGNR